MATSKITKSPQIITGTITFTSGGGSYWHVLDVVFPYEMKSVPFITVTQTSLQGGENFSVQEVTKRGFKFYQWSVGAYTFTFTYMAIAE